MLSISGYRWQSPGWNFPWRRLWIHSNCSWCWFYYKLPACCSTTNWGMYISSRFLKLKKGWLFLNSASILYEYQPFMHTTTPTISMCLLTGGASFSRQSWYKRTGCNIQLSPEVSSHTSGIALNMLLFKSKHRWNNKSKFMTYIHFFIKAPSTAFTLNSSAYCMPQTFKKSYLVSCNFSNQVKHLCRSPIILHLVSLQMPSETFVKEPLYYFKSLACVILLGLMVGFYHLLLVLHIFQKANLEVLGLVQYCLLILIW